MIEIKDNAVFRDGKRIGSVEGESIVVPEKLHHSVVKKLEKETELKVVVRAPLLSPETEGVTPETYEMGATSGKAKEPAPPMDHRGDKTPVFIEWMFSHQPKEAAARYKGRNISR